MKNTQRGAAALNTFIIGLVILVIIAIVAYFTTRSQQQPTQTTTNTATSTPVDATTTVTTTITQDPANDALKLYGNGTLGFSFSYPRDFVVKNEGFSTTTGTWTLLLESGRGTILVHVAKTYISGETKLQNETVAIGDKQGTVYNTRRDSCDARVAQTELDSDYKLQISFESCGAQTNAIYSSIDETKALLSSVKFTNANTRLYINTKLGEAFRYPVSWSRPLENTSKGTTVLSFGKDLVIINGAQYSTGLKRNLTAAEVATGAMTASSTTEQQLSVGGKSAYLLTTTPVSGAKQRVYYIENKTSTDIVIINQKGVDSEGLDTVVSSLVFF